MAALRVVQVSRPKGSFEIVERRDFPRASLADTSCSARDSGGSELNLPDCHKTSVSSVLDVKRQEIVCEIVENP